jgi:hypothetical protein
MLPGDDPDVERAVDALRHLDDKAIMLVASAAELLGAKEVLAALVVARPDAVGAIRRTVSRAQAGRGLARIQSIKPEWLEDEKLAALPDAARRLA